MKNNYVCFDCETGGLDKKTQKHASKFPITEIALISYNGINLNEISRYSTYIKGNKQEPNKTFEDYIPGYSGYDSDLCYTSGALKHTNVTINKLENEGRDYKLVVKELCKEFELAKNGKIPPILVGHNVTYDIPFLQYLFVFAGVDLSKYVSGYYDQFDTFQPYFIDTMWIARSIWEEKNALGECCQKMNIQLFDAHQALADVIATKALHIAFIKRMKNESVLDSATLDKTRKQFEF